MVVFHLRWDLVDRGWIEAPSKSTGWILFGHFIATAFLLLSGIGLALARPRGIVFALRRIAVVALAGALVTTATVWMFPEEPILFGILQCIAATNAVALAALRLPASLRLVFAAAAAAAPSLLMSTRFDGLLGQWLGLAATLPRTLDDRPILPWLAAVLVGTVIGDALGGLQSRPTHPSTRKPLWSALRWTGRHSLVLYLLHQPLLVGLLMLVGAPQRSPDTFATLCEADCAATGALPKLCVVACRCLASRLVREAQGGARYLDPHHLDDLGALCRSQPTR